MKNNIRIDTPPENIEKFKEVVLYIIHKIGSKPNFNLAMLSNLLYFIDFDYYELHEEHLIGMKYIKSKTGPTPVDFKNLINEMVNDGELELL